MRRLLRFPALAIVISVNAFAQNYRIATFAGGGPANLTATSAGLGNVVAVAADAAGNVYLTSQFFPIVLRRDAATGLLTPVAGNGTRGNTGDGGPATSAQLNSPTAVAIDLSGNIYIADIISESVRKISNGIITTVAGNGTQGFSGDHGPASSAQLSSPQGVAVDTAGNLYIADTGNNRIRKVSNGVITTIAGTGAAGFAGDGGPATSAQLTPLGIAVDGAGNLYITDSAVPIHIRPLLRGQIVVTAGNERIRKITNGVIATVAGNGAAGYSGDNGPATSAELNLPQAVAVDSAGNLYIADTDNHRIRKVSNGVITTVAGNGAPGFTGDTGPAFSAELNTPGGVAADSLGNLYLADTQNSRVRKVTAGVIDTIAGNGTESFGGDGGPAGVSQLYSPNGVAADSLGNLYIADTLNHRVRKVSNGIVATVAGNGTSGFSGDGGLATAAQLYVPAGVAVDSLGNLYIADTGNGRIRKVSNGVITTVAGNGTPGYTGDGGPATSAELATPVAVALDFANNLYIADNNNHAIRMVSNGKITTVAGNGTRGYSGDNGPATNAQLYYPYGIAVDFFGNLYIADSGNYRIRRVSNGAIVTFAGNGTDAFSGDGGAPTSASVQLPWGVAVDSLGAAVYIAEVGGQRIRRVANGTILTLAGTGTGGYSGDNGLAAGSQVNDPYGVALDPLGNVYVADSQNNRVRVLTPVSYLVGDSYPYSSDWAPDFGDGSPNILDLIQVLFAVNNIPGFRPAACTDRFDAMDVYPADTTTRGGDGLLDIRDLVLELFRVNNLDTARPVRQSKEGICYVAESPAKSDARSSRAQGALTWGRPEWTAEGEERVPVFLEATSDLTNVVLTFAVGDGRSPLRFAPGDMPPSVAGHDLGVLAVAWTGGVDLRAGERLLLGYVVGPAGISTRLNVYGLSAGGLDDNREIRLNTVSPGTARR